MRRAFGFAASAEWNIKDAVLDALGRAQLSMGVSLQPSYVYMNVSGLHSDCREAHNLAWKVLCTHWHDMSETTLLSIIAPRQYVGGGYVSVFLLYSSGTRMIPATTLGALKRLTRSSDVRGVHIYCDGNTVIRNRDVWQCALYDAIDRSSIPCMGGVCVRHIAGGPAVRINDLITGSEHDALAQDVPLKVPISLDAMPCAAVVMKGGDLCMESVVSCPLPTGTKYDVEQSRMCRMSDVTAQEVSYVDFDSAKTYYVHRIHTLDGIPSLEWLQQYCPYPNETSIHFPLWGHTQMCAADLRYGTDLVLQPLPFRLHRGDECVVWKTTTEAQTTQWVRDLIQQNISVSTTNQDEERRREVESCDGQDGSEAMAAGSPQAWICHSHPQIDGIAQTSAQWNVAMRTLTYEQPAHPVLCSTLFLPGQFGPLSRMEGRIGESINSPHSRAASSSVFLHTRTSVTTRFR